MGHQAELGLDAIEGILGYDFENKNLLQEAFTHSSWNSKHEKEGKSYERLQYLGDSILNMLVAKELFFLYPELPEVTLTELRAANVNNEKLARVAIEHGLDRCLRQEAPELHEQSREYKKALTTDDSVHSNCFIEAPKFLADIVESSIGAVFIDSNCSVDIVWKVFKELLKPMINPETLVNDPRTELDVLCKKRGCQLKFMDDQWEKNGTFNVFIGGQLMGSSTYVTSKKIALCRAAKNALDNLKGTD